MLSKPSFDIDFLTIPLKYRKAEKQVPPQLNSDLSGVIFIGYRNDNYTIGYRETPIYKPLIHIQHFGYSMGVFSGISNTNINPTTTNNMVQQEYQGIVWSKGVSSIIAVNTFTIGLTFGFDNLLDDNNKTWIYENKFFAGIGFGINLN